MNHSEGLVRFVYYHFYNIYQAFRVIVKCAQVLYHNSLLRCLAIHSPPTHAVGGPMCQVFPEIQSAATDSGDRHWGER